MDAGRLSAIDVTASPGRAIWRVAWPVMLVSLLFTGLHVVDLFWVGRLGKAAVAGTALAGSVVGVLFAAGQMFTVGLMATVARAAGAGRTETVAESLWHSLALATAFSIPLAVAGAIFAPDLVRLFRAAPDVVAQGGPYLRVLLAASPGFFCGMLLYTTFQALGDTRTPMYVIAGANVLNAVLDPLLIFGWLGMPRLGVTGAAIATVISQLGGLGLMLALVARRGLLKAEPLRASAFRTLLGIGAPAGLQGITRPLTGMMMFGIVAGFGTAATAAFGIGMRVLEVMFIYLGGLGTAAEVLTGQSLGAGRPDLARSYGRRITRVGLGLQLAVLPLVFLLAPKLIGVFNADPEVVAAGTGYLRVLAPMLVCVGLSVAWAGAQRGAGATAVPMAAAVVANWAVKLPLAIALSRVAGLGLDGVWLGIGLSLVIEAAVLGVGFFRYRWLERKVEWH